MYYDVFNERESVSDAVYLEVPSERLFSITLQFGLHVWQYQVYA